MLPIRNGEVSFWHRELGGPPVQRPALPGDREADIAIIGAGYTGLWSAYYLKRADPSLRIVVLEREFAGFGASGRNGGWLSGEFGWSRERYAADHGRDAVMRLQRAMWDTVGEVIAVAEREGIDADIMRGGALRYAANPAELARLHDNIVYERSWGIGGNDLAVLSAAEVRSAIDLPRALGGDWSPHAARIQPAKLARGLAEVVQRMGVEIFEGTEVTRIKAGIVRTRRGVVRAPVILRATEGFTAGLRGHRRDWLPMNSAMIATEPLPARLWESIGWRNGQVVGDTANAYLYMQRTADDRIAIGGRGIPYRYRSRTDHDGATQERTIELLQQALWRALPQVIGIPLAHAWCGVLGVPRDWCTTVDFDRATGIGFAGGYVGIGVATSNLAGRTLADLVLRQDSPLVTLPHVGHRVRRWEPEPLRWLGVHGMYWMYRAADAHDRESDSPRSSRWASVANAISGRH